LLAISLKCRHNSTYSGWLALGNEHHVVFALPLAVV
jgi:hypothetical protein